MVIIVRKGSIGSDECVGECGVQSDSQRCWPHLCGPLIAEPERYYGAASMYFQGYSACWLPQLSFR